MKHHIGSKVKIIEEFEVIGYRADTEGIYYILNTVGGKAIYPSTSGISEKMIERGGKEFSEILDRITYFYGKTDGSYEYPNSKEGDLLRMIHKIIK